MHAFPTAACAALVGALLTATICTAQERGPAREIETCSSGEPTTNRGLPDEDADGVPDAIDNCIDKENAAQRDTNSDGFGNACDADLNNDNVVNVLDLAILRTNFFQDDATPDADFDGDGTVALTDLAILRQQFFQPPGPIGRCLREPDLCAGPVYFEASDQVGAAAGSLFVLKIDDPASIYHARRLVSGASTCNRAIAGYPFLGTETWNPGWGYHIKGDIFFHGDSVNMSVGCNRTAAFIEANLGAWCNIDTRATQCQFWCPWNSELTRVVDTAAERN